MSIQTGNINGIHQLSFDFDGTTTLSLDAPGALTVANRLPIATTTQLGIVEPDGTTITVDGTGKISVPKATVSALGIVKPDGTTVGVDGTGKISVPTATGSALGLVKPDGTTITVDGSGNLSAVPSTVGRYVSASQSLGTGTLVGGTETTITIAATSLPGAVSGKPVTVNLVGDSTLPSPSNILWNVTFQPDTGAVVVQVYNTSAVNWTYTGFSLLVTAWT